TAEQAEPAPAARSGAVKVKPLVWETPTKADTLIGTYYIREGRARFAVMLDGISIPNPFRNILDEAQAAAQADYERRILAALEPAEPAPAAEPVAWRYETTSEHIARDISAGRFPARSEKQKVPNPPS